MSAMTTAMTTGTESFAILDRIRRPADLAALSCDELSALATEIRRFLVLSVCRTGGHLGPNLGVVELTIALHRVFESPRDRIVFDTGHQSYVHKILTGRAAGFAGLRRRGGLSGYPSRAESEHDLVENSHAATALAWADGIAKANRLSGRTEHRVIAVVGDGALTGGPAWEALNNIAGAPDRPVIIVLNDNGRSYDLTRGGLADHLRRLRECAPAPGDIRPPTVFETLGLDYVGPIDGHDLGRLESALRHAADVRRPIVVHCVTDKGYGYPPAEADDVHRMHVVGPGDPATGEPVRSAPPDWTTLFADEVLELARRRSDLVGVTAAMLRPVGLHKFAAVFPDRVFDVGIAEQHAVTSAAGLAAAGMHPVVAVYSTFLNRAFDQLLLDVCLHRMPVTLVLDRSGITGDDGPSHNGVWDLSMLQYVPHLRIAAPRDGTRLRAQLAEAVEHHGPTAIRFPKGAVGADIPAVDRFGSVDVLSTSGADDVLIVSVGAMAETCLAAATTLNRHGIGTTVVDSGWVKPVDPALVVLAARHSLVVTVEDGGRIGGVGAAVAQAVADRAVDVPVRVFGVPPRFLDHGTRAEVLADVALTPAAIAERVRYALRPPPGATRTR